MLIALAGPAMNFLIALPFFLLGSLFLSMLFGALKSLFFQVLVLFGDPRAIMVVPALLLGALKEHANSFNLLPFPRLDSIDLIRSLVPDRYRSLLAKLDGKKMMFLFIPLQLIIVKVFYGLPFLGIVSFGEKILKTLVEAQ